MDRRTVKTRQMLQDALFDLLHEKPFEAIDIQEITDRADTARVTFYRHYGTKEELLLDVIETIYQGMQAALQTVSVESLMDFGKSHRTKFYLISWKVIAHFTRSYSQVRSAPSSNSVCGITSCNKWC
jgi:AcrR family transcriptional regulator